MRNDSKKKIEKQKKKFSNYKKCANRKRNNFHGCLKERKISPIKMNLFSLINAVMSKKKKKSSKKNKR